MALNKQLGASLGRVAKKGSSLRKINSDWTYEYHLDKLRDATRKANRTAPHQNFGDGLYYKNIAKQEKSAVKYWRDQAEKDVRAAGRMDKVKTAKKGKRKFTKFLDLNSLQ